MRASDFAKAHPWCCFCGGTVPTRTIDHQPPKILFPNKQRPKGMEFPACAACNDQTRKHEPLVALLARFAGGHRSTALLPDKGIERSVRAVERAFPMWSRQAIKKEWLVVNGIVQRRGLLNAADAQLTRSACLVAGKLALAAYYEHHHAPCPVTVKINTMWQHNQRQNARSGVEDLLRKTTGNLSLRDGRRSADHTFYLRYHSVDDLFVSIAILHESVALMGMITRADCSENWMPWSHVWKPSPGVGLVPYDSVD